MHESDHPAAEPAGLTLAGTRRHIAADAGERDLGAAEVAARAFLGALGVDVSSESTADTPRRMAHAYSDLLSPREFDLTTFANDEGYQQLVLVRRIPFRSVCEHHALPFIGQADVGYLPKDRIIGLSKLARVVELYARRPQVQERLTQQIADWLQTQLNPQGVGVVLRAEHMCMTLRGAEVHDTTTVTSAMHGRLLADAGARSEFFSLTDR